MTQTARDIADGIMREAHGGGWGHPDWFPEVKARVLERNAIEAALIAARNAGIEDAAKVADAEVLTGPMPEHIKCWAPETLVLSTVIATKNSIASAIRSLATKEGEDG